MIQFPFVPCQNPNLKWNRIETELNVNLGIVKEQNVTFLKNGTQWKMKYSDLIFNFLFKGSTFLEFFFSKLDK